MENSKKQRKGVMYSTNPDFEFEYENEEIQNISKKNQNLEIYIKKHKAGKATVIIKNFVGSNKDLKDLGRLLKKKCGVGGSARNGEIIIQGDIRDKVIDILKKEGYVCKKSGG